MIEEEAMDINPSEKNFEDIIEQALLYGEFDSSSDGMDVDWQLSPQDGSVSPLVMHPTKGTATISA
jgi:hypothetical protein